MAGERSRAELPLPLCCSSSVGAERCPLPLFTADPAPITGTGEADDPASFLLLLILLSHPYYRQPFLSLRRDRDTEAEKLRGVGQAGTRSCLAFFFLLFPCFIVLLSPLTARGWMRAERCHIASIAPTVALLMPGSTKDRFGTDWNVTAV